MASGLKIGDLARATRCSVETIRFYEREGLIDEPARSVGNYRVYGPLHVERLRFIRNCRSLDMTLDEIRALLDFRDAPEQTCAEVNQILDEHIGHVADRIAELSRLKSELKELRRQCREESGAGECGILRSLERESPKRPSARREHAHIKRTHS